MYPTPRRLRLSPRDRAQRRARVARVALEASARGACHRGLGFSPDALRGSAETARCRPSRGTTAPDTASPTTPAAGPPAANRWTGLVVLVVVNVQLLDVDDINGKNDCRATGKNG